jgi:hypothetical protein
MLTLICAALLGAKPLEMRWPTELLYPGAQNVGGGGPGIVFDGDPPRYGDCEITCWTRDDVPTVMKFYAKKAEQVADLSRDGLVLKLMQHDRGGVTMVVLVSRANWEDQTHIALVYNTRSYEADPPDPFEWAYPGAAYANGKPGGTTRDPFAIVWRYYAAKADAHYHGQPLENGSVASPEGIVIVRNGTRPWGPRPRIELKLIVRKWRGETAVVVISRAQEEQETHIYVSF